MKDALPFTTIGCILYIYIDIYIYTYIYKLKKTSEVAFVQKCKIQIITALLNFSKNLFFMFFTKILSRKAVFN